MFLETSYKTGAYAALGALGLVSASANLTKLARKASHARQRFSERSSLPASHLLDLERIVAEANSGSLEHLPRKFTVPFDDRSKAVLEKIKTKKGDRLVMKTVLAPEMKSRELSVPRGALS